MLTNAYLLAKIGADTAENEQHFAEIWCKKLATTRRRMHAMDSLAATLGPRRRWARRVVANFWQNFARFRLYRHRSLQENTRFAAFFKIYQII